MTIAFVTLSVVALLYGLGAHPQPALAAPETSAPSGLWAVVFAFPVAMALATGVEAPASAIAQLGQLDDSRRRRFGRITLWLTVAIVGTITLESGAKPRGHGDACGLVTVAAPDSMRLLTCQMLEPTMYVRITGSGVIFTKQILVSPRRWKS